MRNQAQAVASLQNAKTVPHFSKAVHIGITNSEERAFTFSLFNIVFDIHVRLM